MFINGLGSVASKPMALTYLRYASPRYRSERVEKMTISPLWAALVYAGIAASPAMAAPELAPGQWEHETKLLKADVPGVPQWLIKLTAGHGSRKSCDSAVQLSDHPETLFKGDDTAVCKLQKFAMSNGKLVYDTFCTNSHFPGGLLVSSRGTYTPTSYSISTTSTGTKDGKPVRILTTGTGKRVSNSCGKS